MFQSIMIIMRHSW